MHLTGQKIALALSEIVAERGAPDIDHRRQRRRVPEQVNGRMRHTSTEFNWTSSGPAGQPRTDTSSSFNGRLRDECLNVQLFFTVADARDKLEQWRLDYNRLRPHSALGHRAPEEFTHASQTEAATASSKVCQRVSVELLEVFLTAGSTRHSPTIPCRFSKLLVVLVSRRGPVRIAGPRSFPFADRTGYFGRIVPAVLTCLCPSVSPTGVRAPHCR